MNVYDIAMIAEMYNVVQNNVQNNAQNNAQNNTQSTQTRLPDAIVKAGGAVATKENQNGTVKLYLTKTNNQHTFKVWKHVIDAAAYSQATELGFLGLGGQSWYFQASPGVTDAYNGEVQCGSQSPATALIAFTKENPEVLRAIQMR